MLTELADILERPKFSTRVTAFGQSILEIVDGYAAWCNLVRPFPLTGVAPDPDDDIVIGTAHAAGAEAIVTGDMAFLSVESWQGTDVITVAQALDRTGA